MASLDTNVLVRFLVEDDGDQLAAAQALLRRAVVDGESLFVPITVALELEWVLRASFGFSKQDVSTTFSRLLSTTELSFQSEAALESALLLLAGTARADFADCLHIALSDVAGQSPFWTFDKTAAKVAGARRVGA